jgi:hypothetical protein
MVLGFIFGTLGLLGLVVIVLLVVIITNALGKRRSVGSALLFGLVALLIVPVLIVGSYFAVGRQAVIIAPEQTTHVERIGRDPDQSSSSVPGVTVAGEPWSNAVEEFQDFQADIYPSIEDAAEALGRRVGARLIETSDTADGGKRSIYVWLDEDRGEISRDVLEAVARGVRQKLDEPAYVSVERPASTDAVAVGLAVQAFQFDSHKRWGKQTESRSGAIALRVKTPDGPFSVSTRFNEAPWLVDRSAFATQYPKGDWLVAYSDGTHTTHEEAKQDAISAAANFLLPLAQARISQLSASDQQHYRQQLAKDPDWLRSRIADELVSRNMLTDQFTQSFDRPYGTVWREAVLVDASPKRVQAIARSLVQGVQSKVVHARTTWLSFFGLGGLVFGTYLFLNMATKGYYTWALRLAALGGLGGAGFLVTHLM